MNRAALAERFADEQALLKTFVLEAHDRGDAERLLRELAEDADVLPTEDAYLHRLVDGDVEFYVDHLDDRFWSFHTWSPAASAHRSLKGRVDRRRDVDWTWLPSAHLQELWREGRPTWLNSDFRGERLLPDDEPARRVGFQFRGSDLSDLLALFQSSSLEHAIAYDQVGVFAHDPAFGSVNEAVTRLGRFVARGDSFQLHEEIVRLTIGRYRRVIDAVEGRALSWSGDEASGFRLAGSAVTLSFGRSIPDLDRFLGALFSSREPFRLWGVPRMLGTSVAAVEAVDLHVGQRLRFEIGTTWLRVFLTEGACGNTVARLVANLQHRFDARVSFLDPELQAALALSKA